MWVQDPPGTEVLLLTLPLLLLLLLLSLPTPLLPLMVCFKMARTTSTLRLPFPMI